MPTNLEDNEIFGGEYGSSINLNVINGSHNCQIVVTIEGDSSSYPSDTSVTFGGNAMTKNVSTSYHDSVRYWTICCHVYYESSAGSHFVHVSGDPSSYSFYAAYSYSGVASFSNTVTGGTSTYTHSGGSVAIPGPSQQLAIIASFSGVPTGWSGTVIDGTDTIDGETVSSGNGFDSGTTKSNGMDWTPYGSVNYFAIYSTFLAEEGKYLFCDPLLRQGNNDGTSWEDAYWSFPDAIENAEPSIGDTVYVKDGTIYDIYSKINPPLGVTIYGGFNRHLTGTDADPDARQPFTDKTIIRMDSTNYATTEFGCISGLNNDVTIDGFHFEDCIKNLPDYEGVGAAIRVHGATGWTVQHCKFENCNAYFQGGAIAALTGSEMTIAGCVFDTCFADGELSGTKRGGAIYCEASQISVYNSSFKSCSAENGGGISINGTSGAITINDCIFDGCDSTYGDAIYAHGTDHDTTVNRCRMLNGLGNNEAILYNCDYIAYLYIKNSLICGNVGNGYEHSASSSLGYSRLINCTVCDNGGYGVVHGGNSSTYVLNSIVYGNTAGAFSGTIADCRYSDIQGGYAGTGNVNVDPQFRGSGDIEPYALNDVTTCVNGASSGVTGYSADDLLEFTRTGTPDMGAIEFQGTTWPIGAIDTSLYRLQMNGVTTAAVAPMNFAFPYRLQETPADLVDYNFGAIVWDSMSVNECYPLQFGSEAKIDDEDGILIEFFRADNSGINVPRIRTTQHTDPSWSDDFPGEYETDVSYIGGTGLQSKGLKFVGAQRDEQHQPLFDVIRYSVMHTNSLLNDLMVYSVWIEGMPETAQDTEPCAAWLSTATSVSQPDYPVSSGLMIELLRIMNRIIWEMRSPQSVPVFGKYIVWVPTVVV